MKRSLLFVIAVCCVVLAQSAIASPAPAPGLVRSYGVEGVADLGTGPGGPATPAWAAARDGSAYVLRSAFSCTPSPCTRSLSLQRYGSDGRLDQGFGGSGVVRLADGLTAASQPSLAVDPQGRVLAAWWAGGATHVARFEPDGTPDASFGSAGSASFGCQCGEGEGSSGVTPLPNGSLLLRQTGRGVPGVPGESLMIWRLTAKGALDGRYGKGGATSISFRWGAAPTIFRARSNGSLVLARGAGCCGSPRPYAMRLSVKGQLVRGFTANAEHSLQTLARGSRKGELDSLIVRPDGKVDVLGESSGGGFVFRLLPDGRRDRSFGKDGYRRVPWPVTAATRDAGGGIFVVSEGTSSAMVAHRLFGNGRVDRRFGGGFGVPALQVPVENGLEVTALRGGRALVFVRGYPDCRLGTCEQQPRLVMFQEPPFGGRR